MQSSTPSYSVFPTDTVELNNIKDMCVHVCEVASVRLQLFATPWTAVLQAPLSVEFSWQECWGGLSWPFPGDLPGSGIEPASLMSPALVLPGKTIKSIKCNKIITQY